MVYNQALGDAVFRQLERFVLFNDMMYRGIYIVNPHEGRRRFMEETQIQSEALYFVSMAARSTRAIGLDFRAPHPEGKSVRSVYEGALDKVCSLPAFDLRAFGIEHDRFGWMVFLRLEQEGAVTEP